MIRICISLRYIDVLGIKKIILLTILIINSAFIKSQYYTGSDIQFGQNRVQYNDFFWQSYDFVRFKIYFTQTGQKHAVYAAKTAHKYLKELESFLDYQTEEKIHFIVFNTQSDFKQSNIGLTNNPISNIGGTARIEGNKVFLYYEGDHQKFNTQIRSGLAELLVNRVLYGDNWKQSLKNSSLLSIPSWFKDGLVDYLGKGWSTSIDNAVKDQILSDNFKKFNHLTGDEAKLAGHAIWNYIDEVYGDRMIPNILYMTRVSKNAESGFIYVLGATLSKISNDFISYYKEKYIADDEARVSPQFSALKIKSRKNRIYQQFKISPDGNHFAYVTNQMGQYKVYIYDLEKDKTRRIAKGNFKLNRIPDYSHPNLAWHPTGKVLAFIEDKKGQLQLNLYEMEDRKKSKRKLLNIEKVLSLEYSNNGKKIVFSGVNNGQTDLYLYDVVGNNQKQLTNDLYDDLHPSFVKGTNSIIFSSNREDTEIKYQTKVNPINNDFDIFVLNLNARKKINQITNSPLADEKYPSSYDNDHYTYLSNELGVYNRYIAYYDSAISHIDTTVHYRYFSQTDLLSNYSRDALQLSHASKSDYFCMLMRENGKYKFYRGNINEDLIFESSPKNTNYMDFLINNSSDKSLIKKLKTLKNTIPLDSGMIDIDNYIFDDEINLKEEETLSSNELNQKDSLINKEPKKKFELPLKQIYKLNFSIDQVIMQMNPTFNNQSYQRFNGTGFQNAGFDGFTLINAKDVFEDHRIIGGFKGPVQINNTGYLLVYENLKHRLDRRYLISRQAYQQINNNEIFKTVTYDLKYNLSYPFSEVSSIRLTNHLRYDHLVTLSTEPNTLIRENEDHYLGGAILEYVFDATRKIGLNIQNGTKFKLWGEFYHELNQKQTDFFVLGLDFRHYQKIHRNIVFASRLAASTSFGSQKLIYYMGGVDNWMWAQFDPSIVPDPEQNYQFQTIATPVRGFYQNARNGNSFAVINNELRLPLFSYFSPKPLKSDFLENFMVIGFNDIGTAWTGINPYSTQNSFNTSIIDGHNYTITLQNQKEPIIYGYGFGLRTRILGYYVRFDWAWGVNDGVIMPSVKHLSLSLDF